MRFFLILPWDVKVKVLTIHLPALYVRTRLGAWGCWAAVGMDDEGDALVALAATVHAPDARRLCADGCVPRQAGPPTPQRFFLDFVSRSTPVIFTSCVEHWPALKLWTHAHLRAALGEQPVHVALTPDGQADAVSKMAQLPDGEYCFVKPCEVQMPFSSFVDAIESPIRDKNGRFCRPVHYASHQNASLRTEFSAIWDEVELSLSWADAAFGRQPAAANFWSKS